MAITVVLVASALRVHRSAVAARAECARAVEQQAQRSAEQQALEERLALAGRQSAELRLVVERARVAQKMPAAVVPASVAGEEPGRDLEEDPAVEARVPDMQEALVNFQRAAFPALYGPFCKELGLSPEERGKLGEIFARRYEMSLDLIGAGRTLGYMPADVLKKVYAEFDAELSGLLGEVGLRKLQDYVRAGQPRQGIVSVLAGQLVREGCPLTAKQGERLTQVLAEASGQYKMGGPATLGSIDWRAALDRAGEVLLPEQLALLRVRAVEEESIMRVQLWLNEWAEEAAATKKTAPEDE